MNEREVEALDRDLDSTGYGGDAATAQGDGLLALLAGVRATDWPDRAAGNVIAMTVTSRLGAGVGSEPAASDPSAQPADTGLMLLGFDHHDWAQVATSTGNGHQRVHGSRRARADRDGLRAQHPRPPRRRRAVALGAAALVLGERMPAAQPRRQRARRRKFAVPVVIGAAAAAAAAITLATSITPGVPVSSAAAAVLNQAAAAASTQQPLVLAPGQYLYTETRSLTVQDACLGTNCSGGQYSAQFVALDQRWLTGQGLGEEVWSVVSPVTFLDGTRKAWIAAGRPKIYDSNPEVRWTTVPMPASDEGMDVSGDVGFPLENVSGLPTDPAGLTQAIQQRKTGLSDVNADVDDPSSPVGTFYAASLILGEDPVGSTPALRSALFEVMAQQPGIKLIGRVTTRTGRSGTGLMTPVDRNRGAEKVIIDPATGQILEDDTYVHGAIVRWTEYLATGVVSKVGQLPNS